MPAFRPFAAAFGLALATSLASAQKDKEVDLGGDFKFTVPAGWKVLKTEKKKDTGFAILQENQVAKGAKSKATIGVWRGDEFIAKSPDFGNVKGGSDLAGAVGAGIRTHAWWLGTPTKPQLPSDDILIEFKPKQKFITATYKMRMQSVFVYGEKGREGGGITAACVSDTDTIEKSKQAFDKVLGK